MKEFKRKSIDLPARVAKELNIIAAKFDISYKKLIEQIVCTEYMYLDSLTENQKFERIETLRKEDM